MPTGYTAITAASIQDASGVKLASGRVYFYPVSSPSGGPVSAIAYGGGLITQTPVPFLVVNGAITTDLHGGAPNVCDVSLTTPPWIAYRVSVTDAAGVEVQGPGYGLVQPTGASFSLDTATPNQPQQVTVQAGPTGPAGTIAVGSVTELSQYAAATVANSGTAQAAVLNFGIPQGMTGATGAAGSNSVVGSISGTFARQTTSASGASTAFTMPVAGVPLVFRNGVLQESGTDYAQSETTITFTYTPDSGDRITIAVFPAS